MIPILKNMRSRKSRLDFKWRNRQRVGFLFKENGEIRAFRLSGNQTEIFRSVSGVIERRKINRRICMSEMLKKREHMRQKKQHRPIKIPDRCFISRHLPDGSMIRTVFRLRWKNPSVLPVLSICKGVGTDALGAQCDNGYDKLGTASGSTCTGSGL